MEAFKLLVVDDEPQVAHALRRLFRREGFDVQVAFSGAEALERLKEFSPDIVLTDFRMPGMTGSELLQRVKRSHPLALRLIISGYADFKSVVASVNEGEICRFISKPWDDAELVSYLTSLLRQRETMAQLYAPFRAAQGVSAEVGMSDASMVLKVQMSDPAFPAEQALSIIERFAGVLAADSLKVVGGLLERYGGRLSFVAEVGGPQRLRLELPVRAEEAESSVRTGVGDA
ncbi:response regulator [Pyxidicoccus fallax]|uniref:Response regulator n=1 Tax=Pyxidicoccus fallax TaxID=394095 RepID=A0A848LYI2_9BACT|nr:response regulator [Pyxidicoccus fallax]NMO23145.1 response regulator [Pyxidicoccus fallax]NPC85824.1 response regulator [Pyxidicoccus fallax]